MMKLKSYFTWSKRQPQLPLLRLYLSDFNGRQVGRAAERIW
jgi:hypothetical protein